MTSKDFGQIQRVLRKNKVQGKDIAELWVCSPTHVSKVWNQERPLTEENFKLFNEKYGYLVTIDRSLINLPVRDQSLTKDHKPNRPDLEALKQIVQKIEENADRKAFSEEDKKTLADLQKWLNKDNAS